MTEPYEWAEEQAYAARIADGIRSLVECERAVNFGRPQDMNGSKEALRAYHSAIVVELGELIQELDWKPWKTRTIMIDRAKVLDETADVLAFLGVLVANVMAQADIGFEEIGEAFIRKTVVNIQRARGEIAGYTPAGGIGT